MTNELSMSVAIKLQEIKSHISNGVKLIAVTKTKSVESIMEAYKCGHRIFGENRAQEMNEKQLILPHDIEWHFIGHLQTNKVRFISSFVQLIHSVDSVKLLGEINKQAQKNDRVIDCLLQFHIATEETKFGLNLREVVSILDSDYYQTLQNIRIVGVMGMATLTNNTDLIRQEFRTLKKSFEKIKELYFKEDSYFKEISMGMSEDYTIAIEEGATMVRIGSAIFGERN